MDGLEATRRIVALGPAPAGVLMLTTFDDDELVLEALSAGATGFLLKAPGRKSPARHRVVADGDALLAPVAHPPADRAVRPLPPRAAPELTGPTAAT